MGCQSSLYRDDLKEIRTTMLKVNSKPQKCFTVGYSFLMHKRVLTAPALVSVLCIGYILIHCSLDLSLLLVEHIASTHQCIEHFSLKNVKHTCNAAKVSCNIHILEVQHTFKHTDGSSICSENVKSDESVLLNTALPLVRGLNYLFSPQILVWL